MSLIQQKTDRQMLRDQIDAELTEIAGKVLHLTGRIRDYRHLLRNADRTKLLAVLNADVEASTAREDAYLALATAANAFLDSFGDPGLTDRAPLQFLPNDISTVNGEYT